MSIRFRFFAMTTGLFILFSLLLIIVLSSFASNALMSAAQEDFLSDAMVARDAFSSLPYDEIDTYMPFLFGDQIDKYLFAGIVGAQGRFDMSPQGTSAAYGGNLPAYPLQEDVITYTTSYGEGRTYVVCIGINEVSGSFLFTGFSLEDVYRDIYYSQVIIIVAIVTLCIIFAIASRHMSKDVLARIQTLSTATQAIAGGDLTHRVEARGTDELTQVMDSFNAMAQQHMEDDANMLELNNRLQSHYNELDTIARNLYHDTQTPLSTIGGYLSVLDAAIETGDVETIRTSVSVIRKAAKSLSASHQELGDKIRKQCSDCDT